MHDYITVSELAKLWQLTPRRVQTLCAQGLIAGAVKFGRSWAVPRDAKRPDDHRERQFRTYAGFTLIEMLVVIAIIAVLVAIVMPTVQNASEKSREAVDLANVRSAYAAVSMAAMTRDTHAIYNGKDVYHSANNRFSVQVPLKQQKEGWSTDAVNVAGIAPGSIQWIGSPKAGGSARVYADGEQLFISWSGEQVALDKRWNYVTIDGVTYLDSSYGDITDNYKASVVSDFLDVKTGDVIHCKDIASAGHLLDTGKYTYTIGFFVVDTSVTNSSGQYKVLRDSREIEFPRQDDKFTIHETGGDLKVAIQFFKKPIGGGKPVSLTESEALALNGLLSK